jgi:hypothetical protein
MSRSNFRKCIEKFKTLDSMVSVSENQIFMLLKRCTWLGYFLDSSIKLSVGQKECEEQFTHLITKANQLKLKAVKENNP